MSYVITIDFQCKPGKSETLSNILKTSLSDTREFEGCESLDVYFDADKECFTAIEKWKSADHYRDYLRWRNNSGIAKALEPILEGGWPQAVASIKWLGPKLEL